MADRVRPYQDAARRKENGDHEKQAPDALLAEQAFMSEHERDNEEEEEDGKISAVFEKGTALLFEGVYEQHGGGRCL
jgi:hypothetical protein